MNSLKTAGLFAAAIFTTVAVSRYLTMNPEAYFDSQREIYMAHPIALMTHVIGGILATLIGPFQFVKSFRTRFTKVHRGLGAIYVTACMLGGCAGIIMATRAHGGFPAGAGFGLLGICWIVCTGFALHRALTGRFPAHREWMIRSYALTLAAFSLRVILLVHGILTETGVVDLAFTDMYIAVAWLCWVPNIILAEIYINKTRTSNAPSTLSAT